MRVVVRVLACAVFFTLAACSYLSCESPIEKERRELREAAESSEAVIYRGLKVSVRSAPIDVDAPADPDGTRIRALTQSLLQRLAAGERQAADNVTLEPADYLALAKEFYELRDQLRDVDEDTYPTMLHQVAATKRAVAQVPGWYTSDWEHLVLAMLWIASQKAPPGFVIYELGELEPDGISEPGVRLAARLLRALAFLQRGWVWLTDEEATAYLADLEAHREQAVAFSSLFGAPKGDEDFLYAQWHAPGVLIRGVARHRKEEEDKALEDFDAFLADAETLGLDNEGVWLIGAYVGLKRDDSERALENLRKLEQSELLGDAERKLVADAIEAVEDRDPDAALASITDKLLIAKVVGAYVLRVLAEVDWEAELKKSDSGRALLGANEAMQAEVDKIRGAMSAEQLEGITRKAGDAARKLGAEARERLHKLGD